MTAWPRAMLSMWACLPALFPPCAGAQGEPREVEFSISGLAESDRRRLVAQIMEGRKRVEAWWGSSFDGRIRVVADPAQRVSMALVPAWRGQHGLMLFPNRGISSGSSPVLHELVHVYAPNQNRFLAEGLAVHAHQQLGGAPAEPNYGKDLHALAREVAYRVPLAMLDRVSTPTALTQATGVDERVCYLIAGSFVGWLLERHGMERFRALYARTPLLPRKTGHAGAPERWIEIYGEPLSSLERDWRIQALRLPPAESSR